MPDISAQRLSQQRLSQGQFANPAEAVAWLGAVQAQDFLYALWAVGLRVQNSTQESIERAIAEKSILRTWAMRGTLHFLASADAHSLLALLLPSNLSRGASNHRRVGLDEATFSKSNAILQKTLQGGQRLERKDLVAALKGNGIAIDDNRFLFLVHRAAVEGLICFGPRRGKQVTFTLLDEWLPPSHPFSHDDTLASLALRYFTGHAPAALKDFTWWSGLPAAEARSGLEMVKSQLISHTLGDQTFWLPANLPADPPAPDSVVLLPDFDEFIVGYADRSAAVPPALLPLMTAREGVFSPAILLNAQIAGIWRRTLVKNAVSLSLTPFAPLTPAQSDALSAAVARFAAFLGLLPVIDDHSH